MIQYILSNWIGTLFICSSIVMLGVGFVFLYYDTKTPRDWQRRIRGLTDITHPALSNRPRRRRRWWQHLLNLLGKWFKPRRGSEISRTQSLLIQAGYRSQDDLNIYYGLKYGLMIYLPTMSYLITGIKMEQLPQQYHMFMPTSLIFFALVGTFLPEIVLKTKVRGRRDEIWRGFPDALDLMSLCVESGLSIDASLHRVANDIRLTHPILGRELRIVSDNIRAGQARAEALGQLNTRTAIEDIQNFTSLVIQTDKLGVSITQGMKKIAESMRTKRRNQAEKLANELPVKLLFPLMIFFLPSIMVVLLLPALLSILQAF